MKQTIKIDVPEGYKAVYKEDTQKVEIVKIELPKTWEEFCENNPIKNWECFITERSKIEDFYTEDSVTIPEEKRARNVDTDKSTLPDRETAEAFLALMQLIQLRDCYRQGWKPNWKKACNKYCIYYEIDGIFPFNNIYNSRVLSFQSEEIRDKFMKNFRELIEIAKELI
ncbi:MAG: hypothetical protein ACFN1J_03030 [Bacteroidota bacterium]